MSENYINITVIDEAANNVKSDELNTEKSLGLYRIKLKDESASLPSHRADDAVVTITSGSILSGYSPSWHEQYDDNIPDSLGTLHFIGETNTMDAAKWASCNGRLFIYTAPEGYWFNIKDQSSETLPANCKKIRTKHAGDVSQAVKACFCYDSDSGFWELVSYERFLNEWFIELSCGEYTEAGDVKEITGRFPDENIDPNTALPYAGFYDVDLLFHVQEMDDSQTELPTKIAQTLQVKDSQAGVWKDVDVTLSFSDGGVSGLKVFRTTMQGSLQVEITSSTPAQRYLEWKVFLPNADDPTYFIKVVKAVAYFTYKGNSQFNLINV